MAEAQLLNEYVLNGVGDPKRLLFGLGDWDWYTDEMLDLVMWMRDFNRSGKGRIEFWGFDTRKPLTALANVRKFLEAVDPKFASSVYPTFAGAFGQPNAPQAVRDAAAREAIAVVEHIEANRARYQEGKRPGD